MENNIYPIDDNIQVAESFLMSTEGPDQNVIDGNLLNEGGLLLTTNDVCQLINGEELINEAVVVNPLITVAENLIEEPATKKQLLSVNGNITEETPTNSLLMTPANKLTQNAIVENPLSDEPVAGNTLLNVIEKLVEGSIKTETETQPIQTHTEMILVNGDNIVTNTDETKNKLNSLFSPLTTIKNELSGDDYLDSSKSKRKSRKQKKPIKTRLSDDDDDNNTNKGKAAPVTVDTPGGVYQKQNDNELPTQQETSIETLLNQFVSKQNTLPNYEIFSKPVKKKSPKKNDQIYKCEQCNKTFSYKCNLQMHAAVHSNEKSHTCSICNKSFKLKGHLDTHRKVHEERYEYRCDLCGKEFKLKGNVKTHIRTKHLEERSHPCPHCDMAFKLKQHLSNHLRIKHNDISMQNMNLAKIQEV